MSDINTLMTSLADGVRELSGTTEQKGISTMTSDVSAANIEINEQADLIAQILTALEGKGHSTLLKNLLEGEIIDLVIPEGVTKIGDKVFCHTENIRSITIPSTVTKIGGAAFERGRGLTNVVIPNTVTEMGDYVFYGHYTLEEITISDNVPSLGSEVFYQCVNLKKITFGKGLKSIGYRTFADASNCLIYDFSRCESIPTLTSTTAFTGINANAKILVPNDLYSSWIAASNWSAYANYVAPDSISFTIGGTGYTAKYGMTWKEWVNSDYNTGGFTLSDDSETAGIVASDGIYWVCKAGNQEFMQANQSIESNYNYNLW